MIRKLAWLLATAVVIGGWGAVAVTVIVERESPYVMESLGGGGPRRALVLYHPSRDAHFSEEVSAAIADGFKAAGLQVDRATLTGRTPARPAGYDVIAVVSNTFWARPDFPTTRYLARAKLEGIRVVGVICGAGDTDRSERILADALRHAGANLVGTQHFWTMRPNEESRMKEPNREVARDMARQLGRHTGETALGGT